MIKKTNQAYRELEKDVGKRSCEISISELGNLFNKTITKEYDVSVLTKADESREKYSGDKNEFEKMIRQVYGDKTGYEGSCNEIIIPYELEKYELSIETQLELAFVVMDNLRGKKNFPEKSVFYIWVDVDDMVNLRFNEYREEEGLWWGENGCENSPNPSASYLFN